jgi:hypothetical protein
MDSAPTEKGKTMREKLIELLQDCICDYVSTESYDWWVTYEVKYEELADHLIANGVTVQEWISVKDRLPEDNERVLVYHDDGVIRFGINKDGFADVVSSLYLKHNHKTCFAKVTHWMPLPEPPKGE